MRHRGKALCCSLLVLLLGATTPVAAVQEAAFGSDRAAAVYFLRPLFPIMDCEGMGVVTKGEVEEHFFALFYSVSERGAFHLSHADLARALPGSSALQVSYLFGMMDRDEDGMVTTAEFHHFMLRAIELADSGGKGEVTLADVGLAPPRIIRARDR